jgi:hypothetical protein
MFLVRIDTMIVKKIVSGGQTGVDRAALDMAFEFDLDCGGWCPKERWAEDAPISRRYPLVETAAHEPSERTKLNVKDSDGTLVFIKTLPIDKGTQLTITEAKKLNKPLLVFTLNESDDIDSIHEWLACYHIDTLNVAGPRESQNPGVYDDTCVLLRQLFNSKPSLKWAGRYVR